MANNITPIEALKEIKFEAEFNGNDKSLKRIIILCDQALAPQEAQEKTFTLDEIKNVINRISYNSYAIDKFINILLTEFKRSVK